MEKRTQGAMLIFFLSSAITVWAEQETANTLIAAHSDDSIRDSVLSGSILNDSLDDFLTRVAEDDEQEGFRGYYSRFLEKTSKRRNNGKKRYFRKLRFAALKNIRESHTEWYKEIEPYVLDIDEPTAEARKVRLFLTRYALLEEYRHELTADHTGWWDTTKGYVKGFGNKIVQLKDKVFGAKKSEVKA